MGVQRQAIEMGLATAVQTPTLRQILQITQPGLIGQIYIDHFAAEVRVGLVQHNQAIAAEVHRGTAFHLQGLEGVHSNQLFTQVTTQVIRGLDFEPGATIADHLILWRLRIGFI